MSDLHWLAQMYELHRRALFLTAWNVLRCPSLAEDAVHSAFLRLARRRDVPDSPKLYVFRAVRNAAIDLARRRSKRREQRADDSPPVHDRPHATGDATAEALAGALERLPDLDREIIELHLHSGLTFRELGELLDMPLQTVATRYRRALDQLRRQLEVPRG